MSFPRDVSQLPQHLKNHLQRHGITLNRWVWHGEFQVPEELARFKPERSHRCLTLLLSAGGVSFYEKPDKHQKGTVFLLRITEGVGSPRPVEPPVELNRGSITPVMDDWVPQGTPGHDAPPRVWYELDLRYTYDKPAESTPYRIQTAHREVTGHVSGGTGQCKLHERDQGTLHYRIGTPVPEADWQAALEAYRAACSTLVEQHRSTASVSEPPWASTGSHLSATRTLRLRNPAGLPDILYEPGYPLEALYNTARSLWNPPRECFHPRQFEDDYRTSRPIPLADFQYHLAWAIGIAPTLRHPASVAEPLLDLIYCVHDDTLMAPLVDAARQLGSDYPTPWAMEAALTALLHAQSRPAPPEQKGNHCPQADTLVEIGRHLGQLTRWRRQQNRVFEGSIQTNRRAEHTVKVPDPLPVWQSTGPDNWLTLDYDDRTQPFPPDTRLRYEIYDPNGERLIEGDNLQPGHPIRLHIPYGVNEVEYRFSLPLGSAAAPGFDTVFRTLGQPVVHLFDVEPITQTPTGRVFPIATNTGQRATLNPMQVGLLKSALAALDLPTEEDGSLVPNTYVLLADSTQTTDQIRQEIEKQLGTGLDDDDWAVVNDQLANVEADEPILLDLTWLYADLLFRATAERYEDPDVKQTLDRQTQLLAQLDELPDDPWYATVSRWFFHRPGPKGMVRNQLWHLQQSLKDRLDELYEEQKERGIIPYRHVNRELHTWANDIAFTVATFFIPVEQWAMSGAQAILAVLRSKYFVTGAAFGMGFYSGDTEAGKFKPPEVKAAQGAIRATAARTLREEAGAWKIEHRAVNPPEYHNLDGGIGATRQVLQGKTPDVPIPPAPAGHHWFRMKDGTYNTKRLPGYRGERLEYDHELGEFFVSTKRSGTPGTNRLKSEFAEREAYDMMLREGYRPVEGFIRPRYGHPGIDALFHNIDPPPPYMVAEVKYGTSKYGKLKDDTLQMSDTWIEGHLERQVSAKVLAEIEIHGYERIGLRYKPDLGRIVKEEITW